MTESPDRPPDSERHPRFEDDLVGLDPDDPEAQDFAAHLDRMQHCEPAFTIESSIRRVGDFAEGSNHVGGLRWLTAVVVVSLILGGVLVTAWDTLGDLMDWLAR